MTGEEILRLIAIIRKIPADEVDNLIVNSSIRFLIFSDLNKLVHKYNAGTLRKFSAAVALIGNPQVLLFEDPDTGIDPVFRAEMIKTVRTERMGGATIVLSSPRLV